MTAKRELGHLLSKKQEPKLYEVDIILDRRRNTFGEIEYLVQWKDYPDPEDNTWQPKRHLQGVQELVKCFDKALDEKKKKKKNKKERKRAIQISDQEDILVPPSRKKRQIAVPETRKRTREKKAKKNAKVETSQPGRAKMRSNEVEKQLVSSNVGKSVRKYRLKDDQGVPKPERNKPEPQRQILPTFDKTDKKWYMVEEYRLGNICQHFFEGDSIIYGVQVLDLKERLLCVVGIVCDEMKRIDKTKEQDYILNICEQLSRKMPEHLEVFWKKK